MARKSFKGGLDNLFVGSGIEKKVEPQNKKNKEISEDEQHWLQLKITRLEKELSFWRTGKLTSEIFQKSLEDNNMAYDSETNQIKSQ